MRTKNRMVQFHAMNLDRIFTFLWITALCSLLISLESCKKTGTTAEPVYMTVDLPQSVLQNETYYSLNYQERSIEMEFSEPIDSSTIRGNISFSHKGGPLETIYKIIFFNAIYFIYNNNNKNNNNNKKN